MLELLSGLLTGGGLLGIPFLGSAMQYSMNKELQDRAFAHQQYMYQHQNQWRVQDLRKAGLNPILATHSSSAMPSAAAASVEAPKVDLADSLFKFQGFSNAKDAQRFARENHEIDLLARKAGLAGAEADIMVKKAQALSLMEDANNKAHSSALMALDYRHRDRDFYRRMQDLGLIESTFKSNGIINKTIDDLRSLFIKPLLNIEATSAYGPRRARKIFDVKKYGDLKTSYKYNYFNKFDY